MNPYECQVVLRARSPLEVFDLSMRVIRDWALPIAKVAGVVLLPPWVLATAALLVTDEGLIVGLTLLVFAKMLQTPFTVLASLMLFSSEAPTLATVMSRSIALTSRTSAAWFAAWVQFVLSGLLLFVPWFILQPWSLFFPEAVLLEGVSSSRAMRRAMALSRAEPARAMFGATILLASAAWVVMACELAGQGLVGTVLQAGTPFGSAIDGDVTPFVLLGVVLAQPLIAIVRLMFYVDVRTSLEGWDLDVALRAAAEEA
jgi:hypothetical protein